MRDKHALTRKIFRYAYELRAKKRAYMNVASVHTRTNRVEKA